MIQLEPHEAILVDTPLFQRLRGIFQTGFTYLVYPCAVHTRFEHSLGCLHVASRILDSLAQKIKDDEHCPPISDQERLTVRLAALLHDISHCIFSHVSEGIYENDPRVVQATDSLRAKFPEGERDSRKIGAAEVIAYSIVTSRRFTAFFQQVRSTVGPGDLPSDVELEDAARIIVGLPPKKHQDRHYLTQIVNGPFDADKLDYQARDGHFTGIGFRVDIERLLASLCIVPERLKGSFLAVDHRGVAAVEQLLFNRMLLYDSVYHHHKNRAAARLFKQRAAASKGLSLDWLLLHDEYDFFSGRDVDDPALIELAKALRQRNLPCRAVVLHPATMNRWDDEWGRMAAKYFSDDERDRKQVLKWVETLCQEINSEFGESSVPEVFFDLPTPPRFQDLQRLTYLKYADDREPILLNDVFPFTSTVNSYAQQAKYRMYVFAWRADCERVAAAAFKVFKRHKIELNEQAFRLAKLDLNEIQRLTGEAIPKRVPRTGH